MVLFVQASPFFDRGVMWSRGSRLSCLRRIGYALLVTIFCLSSTTSTSPFNSNNNNSTYVERCRADCASHKDLITCGKFRVVRWLNDIAREKEFKYGAIRIVRIPSLSQQPVIPKLPESRAFKTGIMEALNFVRDTAEDLITKRALVYTIDNTVSARSFGTMPMIVDEDQLARMESRGISDAAWRGIKHKKALILPLLILFKLMKLKLWIVPIFLAVHFIKKILVIASILLPILFTRLKICKVSQPHHQGYPHHLWTTAAEAPIDYPSGYGEEVWPSHRNDYQQGPPYLAYRNPYG